MDRSELVFAPYALGAVIGGRYRIVSILGRGGMSVVYAADDLKLANKRRAIKVIAPLPGGRKYAEEAKMMMKIEHPHLPLMVDYFPPHDQEYEALVMEYIDGHTVAHIFHADTAWLTFPQLIAIGLQLCSAIRYLHEHTPPIIHRDLKPSNVMIDIKGNVKLIDFGISRQYITGKEKDTVQLGTIGFAAPEQAGTGQSDERTDIYGLGALLYFMASEGNVYRQKAGQAAESELFACLQSDVPKAFKIVLKRLLQSDPQYRYGTIVEVEEALADFAEPNRTKLSVSFQEKNKSRAPINQQRIGLLSISSGAGATFLTHSLAVMLGRQGASVAAVEFDDIRPEWHAWLTGHKNISKQGQSDRIIFDKRYVQYKHNDFAVNWFSFHPERCSEYQYEAQTFEQMFRYSQCLFQLIDFSGRWNESNSLSLLKQAQFVFVIGDPVVVKWQTSELKKLMNLKEELKTSGGKLFFIANKDIPFHGRNEWLSLFPDKPKAIVPLLPQETLLSMQWKGRWATDELRLNKTLKHALLPILKLLYKEMNTE
ncbi:serine/threonine-protein kinase [Bacillus sp. FJAT-28004]|uniref:serine/threonine-protein kinase n=1 Tax=Bacillus sp. FJAT-28004 TaxID=1679165 RepID=UPI0006B498E4|nr:serine/threonine-protein kinase [Bacillus sp. FJAT-28004]